VLSSADLGGVTTRFGQFVGDDDFAAGLTDLLQNAAWLPRGGPDGGTFGHMEAYRRVLANPTKR
jgi:hypothetical protein